MTQQYQPNISHALINVNVNVGHVQIYRTLFIIYDFHNRLHSSSP